MIELRDGYDTWAGDPRRARSGEVDFGVFWTMPGQRWPHWRVSWIADTGELYAKELDGKGRYAVLGVWPTRDAIETYMQGWADALPTSLDWIMR